MSGLVKRLILLLLIPFPGYGTQNSAADWRASILLKPVQLIFEKSAKISVLNTLRLLPPSLKNIWRYCFRENFRNLECYKEPIEHYMNPYCTRFKYAPSAPNENCRWTVKVPENYSLNITVFYVNMKVSSSKSIGGNKSHVGKNLFSIAYLEKEFDEPRTSKAVFPYTPDPTDVAVLEKNFISYKPRLISQQTSMNADYERVPIHPAQNYFLFEWENDEDLLIAKQTGVYAMYEIISNKYKYTNLWLYRNQDTPKYYPDPKSYYNAYTETDTHLYQFRNDWGRVSVMTFVSDFCGKGVDTFAVYSGLPGNSLLKEARSCSESEIFPLTIAGNTKHTFVEIKGKVLMRRVLEIQINSHNMCDFGDEELCSHQTVKDSRHDISYHNTEWIYKKFIFSNVDPTKFLLFHLEYIHSDLYRFGFCLTSGVFVVPHSGEDHVFMHEFCFDSQLEENTNMKDLISIGSLNNQLLVYVLHYPGARALNFSAYITSHNCPTIPGPCFLRNLNIIGAGGRKNTTEVGNTTIVSKENSYFFEIRHYDYDIDVRYDKNSPHYSPNIAIKVGRFNQCLTLQNVLQKPNSHRSSSCTVKYEEFTQDYTYSAFVLPVYIPRYSFQSGRNYGCDLDPMKIVSEVYPETFLFTGDPNLPYNFTHVNGTSSKQLKWDGNWIEVPLNPYMSYTWNDKIESCNILDFSKLKLKKSDAPTTIYANEDLVSIQQMYGSIIYPTVSPVFLTISNILIKDNPNNCCSITMEAEMDSDTIEESTAHVRVDHYTGHLLTTGQMLFTESKFAWSETVKQNVLTWNIPGRRVTESLKSISKVSVSVEFTREIGTLGRITVRYMTKIMQNQSTAIKYCESITKDDEYCRPSSQYSAKSNQTAPKTWLEAQRYCSLKGLHLPVVTTLGHQNIVEDFINTLYYPDFSASGLASNHFLIGLILDATKVRPLSICLVQSIVTYLFLFFKSHRWIDGAAFNKRSWYDDDSLVKFKKTTKFVTFDSTFCYNNTHGFWDFIVRLYATKTENIYRNKEVYEVKATQRCTAIRILDTKSLKTWVDVPCDLPIQSATFLCQGADFSQHSLNDIGVDVYCPTMWVYTNAIRKCIRVLSLPSSIDPDFDYCKHFSGQSLSNSDINELISENTDFMRKLLAYRQDPILIKFFDSYCWTFKWSNYDYKWTEKIEECPAKVNLICAKETLKLTNVCPVGYYQCFDGSCILSIHVCDTVLDCVDGSDETQCSDCDRINRVQADTVLNFCDCPRRVPSQSFWCKADDSCISLAKVCDQHVDCSDGSDEYCAESYHTLRCSFHSQVDQELTDLYSKSRNGDENMEKLCASADFIACSEGSSVCYPRHQTCIYERTDLKTIHSCDSGAHLWQCSNFSCPLMFQCNEGNARGYCIPISHVCDGINDCPFSDDELQCSDRKHLSGFFRCKGDRQLVSISALGDHVIDCHSGDDEKLCADFLCHPECICEGMVQDCNSVHVTSLARELHHATTMLFVQNSALRGLLASFQALAKLLLLDISNNNIGYLDPDILSKLTFLKELRASNNSLRRLESSTFVKNGHMSLLDLSDNKIQTIHGSSLNGLKRLKILNLSSCEITLVQRGSLLVLESIEHLDLSFNFITNILFDFTLMSNLNIDLISNPIHISIDDVQMVLNLQLASLNIGADQNALRCLLAQTKVQLKQEIKPTCRKLIPFTSFRYTYTLTSFGILLTNSLCILWRIFRSGALNILFIVLCLTNCITSLHLVYLVIHDVKYGELFVVISDDWLKSSACETFLTMTNSIYDVTLIIVINILIEKLRGVSQKETSTRGIQIKHLAPSLIGIGFLASWLIMMSIVDVRMSPSPVCVGYYSLTQNLPYSLPNVLFKCLLAVSAVAMAVWVNKVVQGRLKRCRGRVSGGVSGSSVSVGLFGLVACNFIPSIIHSIVTCFGRMEMIKDHLFVIVLVQNVCLLGNPFLHTFITHKFQASFRRKLSLKNNKITN